MSKRKKTIVNNIEKTIYLVENCEGDIFAFGDKKIAMKASINRDIDESDALTEEPICGEWLDELGLYGSFKGVLEIKISIKPIKLKTCPTCKCGCVEIK